MSDTQFFDTLRTLTRHQPFQPFVVELLDGRRIVVDSPSVAFSGGAAASYNSAERFFEFFCSEQVRAISPLDTQVKA